MAEASTALNVFVTGGAEDVGLATVRALLKRGHKVVASVCGAEGALAVRQAGALPVFPDHSRASEVLSILKLAEADVVVHAFPQFCVGAPQADVDYAARGEQLGAITKGVVQAAQSHGVKRLVALSCGYLYRAGQGAAREGDPDARDSAYAPLLAAEALLNESGLSGYIVRSGYIYGGNNPTTNTLADAIKASKRLPAGTQAASWIHEDDLADAIAALVEADEASDGIEIVNAADDSPRSPNDFAETTAAALGLGALSFAGAGPFAMLRQQSFRDKLLARESIIDSSALKERFGWQPRHGSIESGLEACALVWRMRDAVEADDFYNVYEDKAAEAIESFAYDVALPEPVAEAQAPVVEPAAAVPAAPAPKAAAPPPSDGPTPWNEDDAKREERRRKALERKARRAAQQARS